VQYQQMLLIMHLLFAHFHQIPISVQYNRLLLATLMQDAGFKAIDSEWWHFTLKNEPYPDTYFDFPVNK
jgi:D-alanyl-D-alanine dipeptidase